jgi:hypothetical protein
MTYAITCPKIPITDGFHCQREEFNVKYYCAAFYRIYPIEIEIKDTDRKTVDLMTTSIHLFSSFHPSSSLPSRKS